MQKIIIDFTETIRSYCIDSFIPEYPKRDNREMNKTCFGQHLCCISIERNICHEETTSDANFSWKTQPIPFVAVVLFILLTFNYFNFKVDALIMWNRLLCSTHWIFGDLDSRTEKSISHETSGHENNVKTQVSRKYFSTEGAPGPRTGSEDYLRGELFSWCLRFVRQFHMGTCVFTPQSPGLEGIVVTVRVGGQPGGPSGWRLTDRLAEPISL